MFRTLLQEALERTTPALDDNRFWPLVASLDWGKNRSPPDALGRTLARQLTLTECLGALRRLDELVEALDEAFRTWESDSDQRFDLGDDQDQDLREHVVALGRNAYFAALDEPSIAHARAERQDFREGFGAVFVEALSQYAEAELVRAAGPLCRPYDELALEDEQLVRHPSHGIGVVRADPLRYRFRICFSAGDLFVDARPALLN